jgi:peroxiredoxin
VSSNWFKLVVLAFCFCLLLLSPSITLADDAADKLLADSAARTKSLRTLTARIDLSWQTSGQFLKRNVGTVKLMKPNYALIKLTGDYPLVTLVSDGRSRYLFSDPTKYTLASADIGGKNIDTPWWVLPVRFFFTQNVKPFGPDSPPWITSKLAGVETIDGETYNVVELVGEQPMAYVARLYLDDRKILRRSTVTFGEGAGAALFSARIDNVNTGQRLRASDFKFRPAITAKLDTGAESRMLALGDVAPEFSLPTPAGEALTLANLRLGKKATLINFWYLACPPCREEFRLFQRLYVDLKDRGFTIVGINDIDEAAEIRTYVRKTGITFPMVMDEGEPPDVVRNYRIETYPSTYLLNAEGKIVYRSIGLDEAGLRRALGALGLDK